MVLAPWDKNSTNHPSMGFSYTIFFLANDLTSTGRACSIGCTTVSLNF